MIFRTEISGARINNIFGTGENNFVAFSTFQNMILLDCVYHLTLYIISLIMCALRVCVCYYWKQKQKMKIWRQSKLTLIYPNNGNWWHFLLSISAKFKQSMFIPFHFVVLPTVQSFWFSYFILILLLGHQIYCLGQCRILTYKCMAAWTKCLRMLNAGDVLAYQFPSWA